MVKVPRFAFEKFPGADPTLTTHMKSVGEAMAIGRNFTEALQKALRSLESPNAVFDWHQEWVELDKEALLEAIRVPHDGRLKLVMDAIRAGATAEEIFEATAIDPWFVDQLALINEVATEVTAAAELTPGLDSKSVATACLERGLVVNNVTPTALRFEPPLLVSDGEIDEALAILGKALA